MTMASLMRNGGDQSSFGRYLNEIGRVPLLTAAQEIELGRQIQRMRALRDAAGDRELSKTEKREMLIGRRAADKFLKSNLRLAVSLAKKYRGLTHMTLEDLVQEANIGLMRAVELFDPSRGYRFSTYAYGWCQQALTRSIVTKERVVRLPGKVGDMAARWNRSMGRMTVELGRDPTLAELAEEHKVSVADVRLYLARGRSVASLDAVVKEGGGMTFLDFVCDESDPDGDLAAEQVDREARMQQVQDALASLDERERRIIETRFMPEDERAPSFRALGDELGVSRSRVAQLEKMATRKLKLLVGHLRNCETLCS